MPWARPNKAPASQEYHRWYRRRILANLVRTGDIRTISRQTRLHRVNIYRIIRDAGFRKTYLPKEIIADLAAIVQQAEYASSRKLPKNRRQVWGETVLESPQEETRES